MGFIVGVVLIVSLHIVFVVVIYLKRSLMERKFASCVVDAVVQK